MRVTSGSGLGVSMYSRNIPAREVKSPLMFYQDLFSAFSRHQVDYVLIGGLAVSLHGIERATIDINSFFSLSGIIAVHGAVHVVGSSTVNS